ncbi:zinc finger protein BALDIBIS-like [Vicia villosa]|uniref:zinc finger protein BALDIBIS-like n=1 Tax=Vicia villosa TaxID=3911 RepID=UPI00273B1094|nr:zinc finger protein BALDIBIS-like [Vicia villosa]
MEKDYHSPTIQGTASPRYVLSSAKISSTYSQDPLQSLVNFSINRTIVNDAALVSYSQNLTVLASSVLPQTSLSLRPEPQMLDSKTEPPDNNYLTVDDSNEDHEIVELDSVELLAEHPQFCGICRKGFKRDANLRMHMQAHGNDVKTPEALAKTFDYGDTQRGSRRFSCQFEGCHKNKKHRKFKALKSMICVKNCFKRSHYPKMYACDRCHKKKYSVLLDLKSHMKQYGGYCRWKCSCGTMFSRKDKLFGHIGLYEGHMSAVLENDNNCEMLKELIYLPKKLLGWVSFAVCMAKCFIVRVVIASFSQFMLWDPQKKKKIIWTLFLQS